uniref:Coatomer subunit delta n=1 Tax=Rhabditophanes sp. KR3021 TaxID=114890 RepID=A0AC35TQF2_9BILA
MVLIAASIITKSGKALVSRQFVTEMSRSRMEGLLDAFPKLVGTNQSSQRQHTFVETDSVRYVYQPMDTVYMVLITTKASNILEDLDTLRLFARVIPEYCSQIDEKNIFDKAFDLIFAFDEIVALGYKESVNLAQIRTFTEMDSHEERVHNQIEIAKERAAKEKATEKAKELKRNQAEMAKKQAMMRVQGSMNSFGSSKSSSASSSQPVAVAEAKPAPKPKASTSRVGGGKALKLGGKKGPSEDMFLQQLANEGQAISDVKKNVAHHDSIEDLEDN